MADPDRLARFTLVAERMPQIAEAISHFDAGLRQQAYYTLLSILDPDDPEGDREPNTFPAGRLNGAGTVPRSVYDRAVQEITAMHAAALGRAGEPVRGYVEDVADLRRRCLAAEQALRDGPGDEAKSASAEASGDT